MIWVQTVYKGYQQTTKFSASKERVKQPSGSFTFSQAYFIILLKASEKNFK